MRNACAACLVEIAKADFPDEWPDLFDQLVRLLETNSADAVNGSLRVMAELVAEELAEDQLIPLSQLVLPKLLTILRNAVRLFHLH